MTDVFVRVGTDGWAAGLSQDGTISGDGATVAFQSTSPTALANANGWEHVYTRKITTTTRVSVSSASTISTGTSSNPSLSTDAKVVAFDSKSQNLVVGDTGVKDVFFRRPVTFGPFNDVPSFVQKQVADFGAPAGQSDPLAAQIRAGSSQAPDRWSAHRPGGCRQGRQRRGVRPSPARLQQLPQPPAVT